MGDSTRRPLKIPPWQIPYLEKHRIFELFHEITRELVIQQPDDHLLFIKQILRNAEMNRNTSRVIIFGPPKVNCLDVAKHISDITKQVVITENNLLVFRKNLDDLFTPDEKAKYVSYLTRKESACATGWILVNVIRSLEDARAIIKKGVIPTHVLLLIPPFNPPLSELTYCHVPTYWPDYRRTIYKLRQIFSKNLIEICLVNKTLQEIVEDCANLISIKPGKVAIKPRVVLIGPRGSGRKTQAKYLEANLNLVHIDFERLICEVWIAESELGKKLRACKDEVCFHSELLAQVVNKRVLECDALENGWVLTGFPFTKRDLEYLDTIETPPNRIIFLDCDISICKERLLQWKINVHTGSSTNVKGNTQEDEILDENGLKKSLQAHPKVKPEFIDAEHCYYCENYGDIRKYCGGTAYCINGDQTDRWVHESIVSVIIREPPVAPPRVPFQNASLASSSSADSCCCSPIPSKVLDCYITAV